MSRAIFAQTVAPAEEPVTLAEAKAHSRISHDFEDGLISGFITTARKIIEQNTLRALITQTWTATLQSWPALDEETGFRHVRLSPEPIIAVSSVLVDGVTVDADSYALRGHTLRVSRDVDDSEGEITDSGIVITYTAGYGAAAAVPQDLKNALCSLVSHLHGGAREATSPQGIYHQVVPMNVAMMLRPYQVIEI